MIRTLTGKNTFLLQSYIDSMVQDFLGSYGEFSVERIDASEADTTALIQSVQSIPFLVEKKLLVISSVQSNASFMERLDELIDRTADEVEVLLVDANFDKRKTGFKVLQKRTELHEFKHLSERDLPKWFVDYTSGLGGEVSLSDATYAVTRIGQDQQLLAREIEKLVCYQKKITRDTINLLTEQSLQNNIFELLDAAFDSNHERALKLYREQRIHRVDPMYIIAMLSWQIQAMALAVFAPNKDAHTLVSAGLSPYSAPKVLKASSKISKSEMRRVIHALSELDLSVKTYADADSAVELFLLEL